MYYSRVECTCIRSRRRAQSKELRFTSAPEFSDKYPFEGRQASRLSKGGCEALRFETCAIGWKPPTSEDLLYHVHWTENFFDTVRQCS
jgi:hypothetical protein